MLVATRSPDKLAEIRDLLGGSPVELVGLAEIEPTPAPDEEGLERFETFADNALAKARYFHARTGLPTVADDSGLRVDALDGGPGVRTKRFAPRQLAERWGQDEANNRHLLERLRGVPEAARDAHYVCAIAAVDGRGEMVVEGEVHGRIATRPRGSGGFGYDPLFLLVEHGRTYAELPAEVKRATSHRASAARQLRPWLEGVATSRAAE